MAGLLSSGRWVMMSAFFLSADVRRRKKPRSQGAGPYARLLGVSVVCLLVPTAVAAEKSPFLGTESASGQVEQGRSSLAFAAGDTIEIRIVGDESIATLLSGQFRVEPDGSIGYPVIGRLQVGGRMPDEVGAMIMEQLAGHAPVTGFPLVRVAEYAPVYLLGDVARAGPQPFHPGLTVLDLILNSGGLARPPDASDRIDALTHEISDLKIVEHGLKSRRARLTAELEERDFMWDESSSGEAGRLVATEEALFASGRLALQSELAGYQAQLQAADQEIASLEASIRLHDEEIGLLRDQLANQQTLTERGLVPRSQLTQTQREVAEIERQALGLRTELLRARQLRLAFEQKIKDLPVDARIKDLTLLREVELELDRTENRLTSARAFLAQLRSEALLAGGSFPQTARFTIFRLGEDGDEAVPATLSTVLQRSEIVLVEKSREPPVLSSARLDAAAALD